MPHAMENCCQKSRHYTCPILTLSLICSPQLVSNGHMDMVHSKCYGSFMQPASDLCPICTPHVDRIMIETTATDMSISITPCDTHVFLGKLEQALLIDCNTASFPVGSFVHQLQSKEDKGINAAALDSYFKDNGIRQHLWR